jgi:hypothetical protein
MSTVDEEIAAVKADIRNLDDRITVAETGGRSEEYIINLIKQVVELLKKENILLTQRNGKLFTSIAYHLINIIIVVLIAKSRKYRRDQQVFPCFWAFNCSLKIFTFITETGNFIWKFIRTILKNIVRLILFYFLGAFAFSFVVGGALGESSSNTSMLYLYSVLALTAVGDFATDILEWCLGLSWFRLDDYQSVDSSDGDDDVHNQ